MHLSSLNPADTDLIAAAVVMSTAALSRPRCRGFRSAAVGRRAAGVDNRLPGKHQCASLLRLYSASIGVGSNRGGAIGQRATTHLCMLQMRPLYCCNIRTSAGSTVQMLPLLKLLSLLKLLFLLKLSSLLNCCLLKRLSLLKLLSVETVVSVETVFSVETVVC